MAVVIGILVYVVTRRLQEFIPTSPTATVYLNTGRFNPELATQLTDPLCNLY